MYRSTMCYGFVWLGCVSGSVAAQVDLSGSQNPTVWIRPTPMSTQTLPQSASEIGSSIHPRSKSPSERPVIAVDIDETLCITDYSYLVLGLGNDNSKPLPGAPAGMRRLADSFDFVYVTARSRSLAGKTERWLKQCGFPKGRLVTSPNLGVFVFQSGFKRRALGRLRSEYPNLVVGIGDKASDARAYRASRMLPVIVNPWPRQRYQADDVVLRDWAAVSAFFETNLDQLSDADGMKRSLKQDRGSRDKSGGGGIRSKGF